MMAGVEKLVKHTVHGMSATVALITVAAVGAFVVVDHARCLRIRLLHDVLHSHLLRRRAVRHHSVRLLHRVRLWGRRGRHTVGLLPWVRLGRHAVRRLRRIWLWWWHGVPWLRRRCHSIRLLIVRHDAIRLLLVERVVRCAKVKLYSSLTTKTLVMTLCKRRLQGNEKSYRRQHLCEQRK